MFVGIPKIRSTGVVILFGTTNENNEPMTSVLPNPVIPFVKYDNKVAIKRNIFPTTYLPPNLNYYNSINIVTKIYAVIIIVSSLFSHVFTIVLLNPLQL